MSFVWAAAGSVYPEHEAYGAGIGAMPGRVVWFHDKDSVNWDGSGYPDGLIGQEIPLAAQIVSSMARYTELTGDEACGREDALAAMEREAGIKINPDIFEICSKISRQLC